MSSLMDQLQQLLSASGHSEPAPALATQLEALLEHLRMEQLCEQLGTQRQAKMNGQKEDPVAAMLTQLAGALNQGGKQETNHSHQSMQQLQAAAVAAANNQQRVEALLQHQMELFQKSKAQQQLLQDVSTPMPGVQSHLSHQQRQAYTGQCHQTDSQQCHQHDPQLPLQQQHQHHLSQQCIASGAAFHFNSVPSAVPTPPVQQQQQQEQQKQEQQHKQEQKPQEEGQSQQAPKRRRGRPASSSTKMHPNLVYVRRFRERQKQMEVGLEATVKAKQQELQRLQVEQQQLCVKWEALEQVLQVQNHVLSVMQQLRVSDPIVAATAAAIDADQSHSCQPPRQQMKQQHQHGVERLSRHAAGQQVSPCASKPPLAAAAGDGSAQDASSATTDSAVEAAVAEAAAVLQKSSPPVDPAQEQAYLLQQARRFLEPVKIYSMRAAVMLEQLGMLPANAAAEAALAAAKACPATATQSALPSLQATAGTIAAAIVAAAKGREPDAAAKAAAAVAVAVRSAWDGAGAADAVFASNGPLKQQNQKLVDGVPLVQYPYGIGMYVITPDSIKNVCWPLNMETWCVDTSNNHLHAERAGRAMWAVLRPDRWRLLHATWLTMSHQLQQVQQDFVCLHNLLRTIGDKPQPVRSGSRLTSTAVQQQPQQQNGTHHCVDGSSSHGASNWAAADTTSAQQQQQQQEQRAHGLCYDGFETMEDSTAYEYAAAAVQVENVLLREDAISFQLCGAFLELLDPLEIAVGYVSSWPYHPQVFTMFDVVFKLGEPPEEAPTGSADSPAAS